MATNTAGTVARDFNKQMVHYLRKTIDFGDTTAVTVGVVPAGSLILKTSSVNVITAFNAGTTNTIDVGTTADDDLYASALAGGTIASVAFDEFTASNRLSADTTITATYNTSGTAATAGEAEVIVLFIPDNDG
jgi:hypothetical protein